LSINQTFIFDTLTRYSTAMRYTHDGVALMRDKTKQNKTNKKPPRMQASGEVVFTLFFKAVFRV